jgi:hypothetical protein
MTMAEFQEHEDERAAIDREKMKSGAIVHQEPPREPTVMEMLDRAVSAGKPIEYLKELINLKERIDTHNEHLRRQQAALAFNRALTQAKIELPTTIAKTKSTRFDSRRTGETTEYAYEGLDDVLNAVVPVLSRHDLFHTYEIIQGADGMTVTCILEHVDGHSRRLSMSGPRDQSGSKNAIQSIASVMTYLQRYTLKGILGLSGAPVDDDGQAAELKRPQAKPDAMQPRQQERHPNAPPDEYMQDGGAAQQPPANAPPLEPQRPGPPDTGAFGVSGDETKDLADLMHAIDLDRWFQVWKNVFPPDRDRLLIPLAYRCAQRGEAYFKRFYVPLDGSERDRLSKISAQLRKDMDEHYRASVGATGP